MTPTEYRAAATEAEAAGNRSKAAGLRAAATRAERTAAWERTDAGEPEPPAKVRASTIRIPTRLAEIADSLIVPVDEYGLVGTSVADGRLAWNHDGGRAKRPVDDARLAGLDRGDLVKISLAVNARINS